MYEIEFTPEALEDLKALKKFEQKAIIEGIEIQLAHAPTKQTRNRKKLRPNDVAEWELRIGKFRVFYNVYDEQFIVSIEAAGLKIGNLLFFRGKERKL
ncbi:MAG: type II toxin-antitoxin system RelE/ParE family toxin [candidate division KSB1 bacterium]|nr:type II toxin-antitoxin system RelE/ParE family toxin [candidate division KSB1 bacterium]MDZ7366910.1 type II toxin-antitoxin system RelE/ParE family toxin [candidate division KSB1 bacterium]MDZ7406079.1 type II toxin-antitoxin system RelE/ParE family toxin [candidate division KSB1 bacterium]